MKRRAALSALPLLATAPLQATVDAATPRRLGVLLYDDEAAWDFLRRDLSPALARLGWHEGRNLVSNWRFADGDASRLPALAQALVRDGADVLLTRGTPCTRALQQATRSVPIVTGVGDPVGSGLAKSLAAPGGNITGLSYALVEQAQKQLELLRELVPSARHLLLLMHANRAHLAGELFAPVEKAARAQGLQPQQVLASRVDELQRAAAAARQRYARGTLVAYAFGFGQATDLALAVQRRGVPTVYDQRAYVDAGGLMSYQLFWDDQTQRTAVQLDKVLRGQRPGDIPFEQPTRSKLVINASSAKALGLTIAPALLARADEVIQ